MANSYINQNLHIIFHVKSTGCIMKEDDLSRIFAYIGGIVRELSGYAYQIGGRPDHIHLLVSMPATICLSDFVRTIKANVSKWIRQQDIWYKAFSWQDGYGAFSVSASNKQAVIDYILKQEEHHRKLSAQEEFILFLKKHGLQLNQHVEKAE